MLIHLLSNDCFSQIRKEKFEIINDDLIHDMQHIKNELKRNDKLNHLDRAFIEDSNVYFIKLYHVDSVHNLSKDTQLIELREDENVLISVNPEYSMYHYVYVYPDETKVEMGMSLKGDIFLAEPFELAWYLDYALKNNLDFNILSYKRKNGNQVYFMRCFNKNENYYLLYTNNNPIDDKFNDKGERINEMEDTGEFSIKFNKKKLKFNTIEEVLNEIAKM